MTLFSRGIRQAVGLLALVYALTGFVGPALAQENLDSGKSPAQLFASDCALCHKSPQGLAKSGGVFGLDSFLREHYTASRESAAKLSAYLKTVGDAPAPAKRTKRATKSSGGKDADKKPSDTKSSDSKASDSKAGDTKSDAKSEAKKETKSEPKPKAEAKTEAKSDTKSDTKSEAKTESKPAASAKPDKPAKTD